MGLDLLLLCVGAMSLNKTATISEQHLGLQLPQEHHESDCFLKLSILARENVDINGLLELAPTAMTSLAPSSAAIKSAQQPTDAT
jgi:cobyrinic acid a,c-diamide synthase